MGSENLFKISRDLPVPEWIESVREKFLHKLAVARLCGDSSYGVDPLGYIMEDFVELEENDHETWLRITVNKISTDRFRCCITVSSGVVDHGKVDIQAHHFAILTNPDWWMQEVGSQILKTIRTGEEVWPRSPIIESFKTQIMRQLGMIPLS